MFGRFESFFVNLHTKYNMSVKEDLGKALAYVGLLVLFTYTNILLAGVSENVAFWDSYVKSQGTFLGLFVNIGLLLLLVIDYEPGQSMMPKKMFIGTITAIMIAVAIAGLAYNCHKSKIDLIWMFDSPWFILALHIVFIVFMIVIKYVTLISSAKDLTIKKEF